MLLILQIGVIIAAARCIGLLFRKFQQPQVIGEIVAGLLLGPSLLGHVSPALSAQLFPPASLGALNAISQVGLMIYMFLVGLELDLKKLRSLGNTAVVISQVSIVVPFLLGILIALFLYPRLSDSSVRFIAFALFMGAAMSVTAFPVLARILTDRKLLTTEVGTVSIACAAVDDVSAWCILAGIIALLRADEGQFSLLLTLGALVFYLIVMIYVASPLLRRLETSYLRGGLSFDMIAVIILVLLASGWVTEWLGVHALFGAFFAGVISPKNKEFAREVSSRFEPLTVVLMLPLFFALTGLRTNVSLISGYTMWFYCLLIIFVAIAGKLGGAMIAARVKGMPWRESAAIGLLMNTRGLVELVILNIGLDMGVLSPTLFSMMVLMALTTTFMATPLLHWVYPEHMLRSREQPEIKDVAFEQAELKGV
ncbi:MAG TPA: cation:proton antiporter [Pyrinomonadaceae bacterium]|jgi:Kef-type K+ transport system membrane component KefB